MLSGAICGVGGCFFAQYFLYIDPTIVFGVDKSVEMLLVSMIGGAGTIYGPLIGAVLLAGVAEATRAMSSVPGDSPVPGAVRHAAGGHHRLSAQRPDRPDRRRARRAPMLKVEGSPSLRRPEGRRQRLARSREGRIVALIGPNGAGKTTLFASIAGFHPIDAGRVTFMGQDITALPAPDRAARHGAHVPDHPALRQAERAREHWSAPKSRTAPELGARGAVAEQVGMSALLEQPGADLTVAGRKRLELARTLATGPKLLLLDEVMAGLNPSEIVEIIASSRRSARAASRCC